MAAMRPRAAMVSTRNRCPVGNLGDSSGSVRGRAASSEGGDFFGFGSGVGHNAAKDLINTRIATVAVNAAKCQRRGRGTMTGRSGIVRVGGMSAESEGESVVTASSAWITAAADAGRAAGSRASNSRISRLKGKGTAALISCGGFGSSCSVARRIAHTLSPENAELLVLLAVGAVRRSKHMDANSSKRAIEKSCPSEVRAAEPIARDLLF